MLKQLVINNLRANRNSNITFIISNAIVYAIIFILFSLTKNEYVLTRSDELAVLMLFGAIVIAAIAVIFTLYAQRLLFKKRARELSLYQVLGLEKKHISRMLLRESLVIFTITSILTTLTGYVMGLVSFLLLRKILNFTLEAFNIFEFNVWALGVTLGVLALSFILNLLINISQVASQTPTELIRSEKAAEKEPKTNGLLLLLGGVTLALGYTIAIIINDPLSSLLWLFVAIILVIIGTYCLFTSLSILLLKFLRRNKSYYYQKKNFLSLSNLLYRVKSHAVSLATITILCSGVILIISASSSLGQGLKNGIMENDYELVYTFGDIDTNQGELAREIEEIEGQLEPSISRSFYVTYTSMIETSDTGEILLDMDFNDGFSSNTTYLTLTIQNDYERSLGKDLPPLKEDEVYYFSSKEDLKAFPTIKMGQRTFNVQPINYQPDSYMAFDITYIAVRDLKTLQEILTDLSSEIQGELPNGMLGLTLIVNEDEGQDLGAYLQAFADEHSMRFTSKSEQWEFLQSFSGGFFFLGVLLSIVLTIITSLILYYKQISEAEADRRRFLNLQKLGVSEEIATKTIQRQMRSVFLSPIIVAVIHNLVASKIVSTLLKLFNVRTYWDYFTNLVIVSICFVLVYLVAYRLSQKAYKEIVWK